ncbi:MAG: tetratricopeptide repeat protein [Cytophagales bacterium]|nr:MAG: tetratricopeptide repeat protein [Cytophagales bacterium]
MKQLSIRSFFVLLWFLITNRLIYAQHSMDNIVELLNNRELTTAKKLLSENIVHDAEDMDSRLLLGSLTDYFGETEDAIKIWVEGLRNTEDDYPLYINIGEIRLRQGLKGMNVKFKKGKVEVVNQADSIEDANFKSSMLHLASEAFEKAHHLSPYEEEPLINLGKLHNYSKNYVKALLFWEKLGEMYPTFEEYWVKAGNSALNLKNYDKALENFNKAMEINKGYAPIYDGLSDYYLAIDNIQEAEIATQKGAFYNWLPAFCEMEYSQQNYRTFELINFGGEKLDEKEKIKGIKQLVQNKSDESTKFLSAICYYHEVSEELESIIFDELGKRNTYSLFMITEIARNSEYLCAIDHAIEKLMEIKPAGLFNLLVELIQKDQHETETIRIAEHLGNLGNEQAVLHLAELLNVDFQSSSESKNDNIGERKSRQRAALALANFNNPHVINLLEQGLTNTDINLYCAAALYKMTLDERYLKILNIKGKDSYLSFFLKKIETKEAQKLAKKLG